MIQRIQSVYLLLAFVAIVASMMLPVGDFFKDGILSAELSNLWLLTTDGQHIMLPYVALFAALAIAATLTIIDIFLFKNRRLQMTICTIIMFIILLYVIFLGYCAYFRLQGESFTPTLFASFPFASFILVALARKAINNDEKLIRSVDRLR